jgi:hypothetical protein
MLERLASPENVLAFRAVGKVEASDYDYTLDPAVGDMLKSQDELRFVYVLGEDFEGYSLAAVWEDTKLGVGHVSQWKRIAVVSNHDWVRHALGMFGWMVPGEVKVFPLEAQTSALEWAAG